MMLRRAAARPRQAAHVEDLEGELVRIQTANGDAFNVVAHVLCVVGNDSLPM